MHSMTTIKKFSLTVGLAFFLAKTPANALEVRIGRFANLTHAPAMVVQAQKLPEKCFGPGVSVKWRVFLAGPAAMEALLAGALDLVYVGPSPAINTFVRTEGKAIRIVAGATTGGGALVAPKNLILPPASLKSLQFASVQTGNTQDIILRYWLEKQGVRSIRNVRNLHGPDLLTAFQTGFIQGAWVAEPWVSRLELQANGKVWMDEEKFLPGNPTTLLAGSPEFVNKHPDLLAKYLTAHLQAIEWMNAHPAAARNMAAGVLKKDMGKALSDEVVHRAWKRLKFSPDPNPKKIRDMGRKAQEIGFLGRHGKLWLSKLDLMFSLNPLNRLLRRQGKRPIFLPGRRY